MTDRYKLILFKTEGWGGDRGLYREVELGPELEEVRIGTSADCAVRLRRELFFCPGGADSLQKGGGVEPVLLG